MIEHDACIGCLYEDESSDSVCCQGCTQNAMDRYVPAPTTSNNIQEALNNLPIDLIGEDVWTHYVRAVVSAEIVRIETDSEGTRVYLFCEAIGGEIERRPEDIYDTAHEAIESLDDKTTI